MTIVQIAANEVYTLKGIEAERYSRKTKTRVDIDVPTDVMEVMIGVHPAYSMKGEDLENDLAWKAYNRAEVKAMKAGILEANKYFNFLPADGWKLSFSRTAGCGCGCSPAFVLTTPEGGMLKIDGVTYSSVWVNFTK